MSNWPRKMTAKEIIGISKKELARFIDHTLLKPEATPEDIIRLCRQAKDFGFATVCVNPCYVSIAAEELAGCSTGVCTVVGFPLGASDPAVKAAEAAAAVRAGAAEVDMVLNIGFLKGGLKAQVQADIAGVVQAARQAGPGTVVKVIVETCLLADREKVEACRLAMAGGADFVKTSTGFGTGGATVHDVALLRRTVGPGIGVKASGGIRDLATALAMLKAGANRLGTSSGVAILNEFKEIVPP